MGYPPGSAAVFRNDIQRRLLLACVGGSIALHALALFIIPGSRHRALADRSKVLTAFVIPDSQPAAPVAERRERALGKPYPRQKPAERYPTPIQPSVPVASPQPALAPAPGFPKESTPAPSTNSPSAVESRDQVADAKSAPSQLDVNLLENYRLALIDAARRYRRYPMQAMDRGWQGRVEIRLVIDASGAIKNAVIKTSSRYAVLDDQALDMVKRGKSLAKIPPALSGREFTIDVPVIFELQAG